MKLCRLLPWRLGSLCRPASVDACWFFLFLVFWMECSFYNLIMIYATILFNYSLSAHLFSRPRQNQGLLYKHLHHSLIKWLSQFLWKISSRRRHAQTVKDSASSRKKNYSDNFFKNFKSQRTSKVTLILLNWWDFAYWWSCIVKGLRLPPAQQDYFC